MTQRIISSTKVAISWVCDILNLFRWQFWGVSIIPVLIGYSMSQQVLEWPRLIILLVIFGPCLEGGAEAINDFYDVETDRLETVKKIGRVQLSGGTGLLQKGVFAKPMVLCLSIGAYATAIILAICLFSTPFIMTVFSGVLLGIGYSAPPLRFKARGLLGPLSVGVTFGFVTLLAGLTAGGIPPHWSTLFRMLPLIPAVTGLFLTHQIVDYEADMKSSVKTFCVRYGLRTTRVVSGALILVGSLLAIALPRHSPVAWPVVVLILAGILWILIALARDRITAPVRVVAVLLEATVGIFCLV